MKQEQRIVNSRDEWKNKAVARATELREARKLKATHKEKIRFLTMENKELHDRLKKKTLNSPH